MADLQRWYAARAKPGQANIALANLERQEFIAYYPSITIERWRDGRITRRAEPLFPGYLLIRFALDVDRWRSINGTRGIIRLLSFAEDGKPSPMPEGEIEALQERENSGQLCISEIRRFRRGDRVKIKFGWAADKIGSVLFTRGERVTFLLSLLGQKVSIRAPMHALEHVAGESRANDSAAAFLPDFLTRPVRIPKKGGRHGPSNRGARRRDSRQVQAD